MILYHGQHTQTTDIILNWIRSQNDSHWRRTIIEALWTIKAKRALQMVRTFASLGKECVNVFWGFQLGLDLKDLRIRFLKPTNADVNLYIHPVLKALYCICEQMEPIEAKQLIDHVNNKDCGRHQINFTDEKYLEVFLLHWISELVVEAGEWSLIKSKRNVFCKVDVILEFLNANRPDLAELLSRINVRFNFTSNNLTSVERKKNVTDDDGHDDKLNNKVSQSDDQKTFIGEATNGSDDRYRVERKSAGYVLIINQIEFYRDKIKRVSRIKSTEEFEESYNCRL